MKKVKSARAVLLAAVLLVVIVVVGIAAGVGLFGKDGKYELVAQHDFGEYSVEIYGHSPALFPEGFLRGRIVCRQGGDERVVDERTFSFGTDDGTERFSFAEDGGVPVVIVHDEHGDIRYDIALR